jgi:pyroglutamyl-peptidase
VLRLIVQAMVGCYLGGDFRMSRNSDMLITGFEGYGGRGLNPAAEVARALDGQKVQGTVVRGAVLPVSYAQLSEKMGDLVKSSPPRAIICLGLWPGEPMIRLERFGTNVNAFEIADNVGDFESGPIEPDGPLTRPATLPLERIEARLLAAGIPARLSSSAGNFLCNALLYKTLGILEEHKLSIPCGFVHIPYLPVQVSDIIDQIKSEKLLELHQRADLASMALDTTVEAIRIAAEATLESGT